MPDKQVHLAILGTRGIPASYGGFETFAEELSVRLVANGVETTVYCIADSSGQPATYQGVRLAYLPSPNLGPLTTVLFDALCLWHARKRYDVVYMLGYGSSPFCFLPRLWGGTVWINMDGIEWKRTKWGTLAKLYLRFMEAVAMLTANMIIADAEGIRMFLRARHGGDTPCSVIPYGAQLVERTPEATTLASWGLISYEYYLVVCRLEPENHVIEIINGYRSAASPAPLVIVGDNRRETAYIRSLLSVREDRIRFIGTVYDRDKLNTLRYYCKAYLHGHSVGGTNPSLLEALGCGNIVLAHDNVFNREVAAEAGKYFLTAEDIPELIREVESLDGRGRSQWADRARQRIINYYNWDEITKKYLDLLNCDSKSPDAKASLNKEGKNNAHPSA
jgi:glycosyltransferase involved in cell wall biosynthesis